MYADRAMLLTRRSLLLAPLALAPLRAQRDAASRAERDGSLKVTHFVIRHAQVRNDWRTLVLLEIHTDGGLVGLGEGTLPLRPKIAEEALRWLEPHLVGRDPAGPEEHWNRLYYETARWRRGGALTTALSAVDIALWDLEGKRLGVPVWRLLGGRLHSKMRAYYSHWNYGLRGDHSPDAFARRAEAARKKGWTAVKWAAIGADPAEKTHHTVSALKAIRDAVGMELDVGIEMAEWFTVRTAVEFAEAVAPYKPMFIEEPIWREHWGAFERLAERSPVPIATGEGYLNRSEFKPVLDLDGVEIVQPDVVHCGGITELKKIANFAEVYDVQIAPHSPYGPVGHVASMHGVAACRNFFIHEWEAEDDELHKEVTNGTFPTIDASGEVTLPDGPGLGIELDAEELSRRFPLKA